jgi:hypothetical protein
MKRTGSALLELLLALAIFVVFAIVCVRMLDQASATAASAVEQSIGMDLCRTAMVKIEIGAATPETLSGPVRAEAGSSAETPPRSATGWELVIQTEPSDVEGMLNLSVEAVRELPGGARRSAARLFGVIPDARGNP